MTTNPKLPVLLSAGVLLLGQLGMTAYTASQSSGPAATASTPAKAPAAPTKKAAEPVAPLERPIVITKLAASGTPWTSTAQSATSSLKEKKVHHVPSRLTDGDVGTSWCEADPAEGIGESFTLTWACQGKLARLGLHNGYARSQAQYDKNARPSKVRLTLVADGQKVLAQTSELPDQRTELFVPLSGAPCPEGASATLTLEILGVHPGTKYQDTCVSEVILYGDGADPLSARVWAGKPLVRSVLDGQDCAALWRMRNAVYARHGYAFSTEKAQAHFGADPRYTRKASVTSKTIGQHLSDADEANRDLLVAAEESGGCR